jgi:hypothetical protein
MAARGKPVGLRSLTGGFWVVMGTWIAVAFLATAASWHAPDGISLIVAGEFAHTQPDQLGPPPDEPYFLKPKFEARACELTPPGSPCYVSSAAYISPPAAIPLVVVLASTGPDAALFILRLGGALALVCGMALLAIRLSESSGSASSPIVWTGLLLVPFVFNTVGIAQTTPLMFLSAAIGLKRLRTPARELGGAVVLVAITALKLYPLALLGLLIVRRRWRMAAMVIGMLAALTASAWLISGNVVFQSFLDGSSGLAHHAGPNPYSGSIDSFVYSVVPGLGDQVFPISMALRVIVAIPLVWFTLRIKDEDVQWTYGWLAILVFIPLVWWPYLWVAVAAVATTLASKPRSARAMWILPGLAAIMVPFSILQGRGSGFPPGQALFLFAVLGALTAMIHRDQTASGTTVTTVVH